MKKIALIFVLFLGFTAHSQGLYVEVGKVDSNFKFTNSEGEELANLQHTTQNYMEAGYRRQVFTEGFNVALGLNYNSYGSVGGDNSLNNFFEWDADYLGIVLGFDYALFDIDKLEFHLKATASLEFMLQGTQTINNQVINLTDTEEFDDNAIFFRGGAGLSYPLTETSSIYLQYLYGQSLGMNDDNNGSTSQEELKINTHMVGIGIRIAIPSKDTDVDNNEESEE